MQYFLRLEHDVVGLEAPEVRKPWDNSDPLPPVETIVGLCNSEAFDMVWAKVAKYELGDLLRGDIYIDIELDEESLGKLKCNPDHLAAYNAWFLKHGWEQYPYAA